MYSLSLRATAVSKGTPVQEDRGVSKTRQLLWLSKGTSKFPGETSDHFRILAAKTMFRPLQALSLSQNSFLKFGLSTIYST